LAYSGFFLVFVSIPFTKVDITLDGNLQSIDGLVFVYTSHE